MCSRGTAVETTASRKRGFADQHVIGRAGAVAAIDAEAGRGVALRIEIDDQDALADRSECRAEIDRRGCFSHAALLIRQRQDARVALRDFAGLLLLRFVNHAHRKFPTRPLNASAALLDGRQLDDPTVAGTALVKLRLNIPIFSGFGQFSLYILTLRETALLHLGASAAPQSR